MRHSPFARLKQELRLARQLSLHGQKSYFVPAGRRLSGIVRRRPNVGGLMFTFTSFFLRPAAFDMRPPVSFLADAAVMEKAVTILTGAQRRWRCRNARPERDLR